MQRICVFNTIGRHRLTHTGAERRPFPNDLRDNKNITSLKSVCLNIFRPRRNDLLSGPAGTQTSTPRSMFITYLCEFSENDPVLILASCGEVESS